MASVARLVWTRPLAETYWRGVYEGTLPQARREGELTNVVLATLASWIEPGAKLLDAGGRTGEGVQLALSAGFFAARLDLTTLCQPLRGATLNHPRYLGGVTRQSCIFDAAFVVDLPAQLLDEEISDYFRLIRSLLVAGGKLAFSVPNGECLDTSLAIDPSSGTMFHPHQRVRCFTVSTLVDLLRRNGFSAVSVHQVETGRRGLVYGEAPFEQMAQTDSMYLGNGNTLVVVASVMEDAAPPGDVEPVFVHWRAQRARALPPLPRTVWTWTPARTVDFWSYVAGTPLDGLSFAKQNGANLLSALEGWLKPGGRHLDVGAGDGHAVRILTTAGYPTAALEPAPGRRKVLDAHLSGVRHYIGAIEAPDPAEPFDVVLALEVIEHIGQEDIPGFVAALSDCLVADGVLILSTPCREDLSQSEIYSPVSGSIFHRWQHVQSWTPERLRRTVEEGGFTVEVHHEIDLAGIAKGRHPFFLGLLSGTDSRRIGEGGNLILVARKGIKRLGPRDIAAPGARSIVPTAKDPSVGLRLGIEQQGPAKLGVAEAPRPLSTTLQLTALAGEQAKASIEPPRESAPGADIRDSGATTTTRVANRFWRLAERSVALLRPVARRVLSDMMKRRIRPHLVAFETRRAKAFARAASGIPLSQVSPLLPVDAFRLGPVVLANNALAWGGVERQVVNTLKGLEGLTDRPLHLLCLKLGAGPDYDFYLPALDGSRCAVRNAAEARNIRTALSSNRRAIEALIAWMPADVQEDIFRYLAEFLRLKPEVVHAWQDGVSLAAGFAARIAGVPRIIVSSRNMNPTNFAYFRPYMQRAYRELADCSDIIMINNSEAGVRDYAAWLDLPPTRWIVVRNGLNHQEFRRAEPGAVAALRRSIGISDGVPIVGSVFRFYDEKRPMLWVETAALLARRHPTCHFVVFGTGPMRAHMLAAAATAGFASRLHLPGPITQTPVALSLFDAFLLTSSLEGTPNVVLEASAVGVPVVATDAGGTREAVEEGVTGFVVADPAPHTLAERLNEILEDLDRWRVLREQGPAFVESRFGLDRMLNETLSLYGISDTRAR